MKYSKAITFAKTFTLKSGYQFPKITIAYETYGKLNKEKNNAILICHALSGDSHVARHSSSDDKGWWEGAVGPGMAYDTNKYFVICSNVLGGCKGSTGPMFINPQTNRPYGFNFPVVTIQDMVKAQKWLLEALGIKELLLVTGGSMGGMQALQWAVTYPDYVKNVQILASTGRVSPQSIALNEVARQAIYADPNWNNGDYYEHGHPRPDKGLAVARMLGHITYLCEESMQEKFGRRLREKEKVGHDFQVSEVKFEVESYLRYNGENFTRRFDANSLLYVTKAIDYFDISEGYASIDEAISRIKAKVLIASFSTDWLFPPAQSVELASALLRNGINTTYTEIESSHGHDAFLIEIEKVTKLTKDFLNPTHTSQPANSSQISLEKRCDYNLIFNLIPEHSKVLDLGCGTGELIEKLSIKKGVETRGVDLSESNVRACIAKGLAVRQGNIEEGLKDYSEQEFDYVILSQTLAFLDNPMAVVKEMLRISQKAVISFENAGFWKDRLNALHGNGMGASILSGKPRYRAITLEQFEDFVKQSGAVIERAEYFSHGEHITNLKQIPDFLSDRFDQSDMPSLITETALYIISAERKKQNQPVSNV